MLAAADVDWLSKDWLLRMVALRQLLGLQCLIQLLPVLSAAGPEAPH
jgi:hypothetical protein